MKIIEKNEQKDKQDEALKMVKNSLFMGLILIAVGLLDLYVSTKFLMNKQFARKYIESSPKAWLWRKIFGVNKATMITRQIFAPVGLIVGVGLIVVGFVLIFI